MWEQLKVHLGTVIQELSGTNALDISNPDTLKNIILWDATSVRATYAKVLLRMYEIESVYPKV